jgi:hypothetical protein
MLKKEKICLLISIAIPGDSNINTQESEKLSQSEDQGQQDVESEDKSFASYNWSLRNN